MDKHTSLSIYALEGNAAKKSHSLRTGNICIPAIPATATTTPVFAASAGNCLKNLAIILRPRTSSEKIWLLFINSPIHCSALYNVYYARCRNLLSRSVLFRAAGGIGLVHGFVKPYQPSSLRLRKRFSMRIQSRYHPGDVTGSRVRFPHSLPPALPVQGALLML